MTIGDILIQINQANLDTMLPLTAVKTSADIERYYKEGYSVGITADEFAKKYPRLPVARIYATHNMLASLYYCELSNPIIPIVLFSEHLWRQTLGCERRIGRKVSAESSG